MASVLNSDKSSLPVVGIERIKKSFQRVCKTSQKAHEEIDLVLYLLTSLRISFTT